MARREAFKMYLKKGFEKEYEWRHRNIWPEVKAKIEASGVYDYSIFLDVKYILDIIFIPTFKNKRFFKSDIKIYFAI